MRSALVGLAVIAAFPVYAQDVPAVDQSSEQASEQGSYQSRLFGEIVERARQLADSPYEAPDDQSNENLENLTYDDFRNIRFRPDRALWHDESLFEVQFFHMGFLFQHSVGVNIVEDGASRELAFDKSMFRYDVPGMAEKIPDDIGYAGFRLHYPLNSGEYKDEVAVFLGASYFRVLARDQVYGISARGLAVDTATARGEEFPAFREFWLVKPEPEATEMTIYAILDSKSVTGAYRFVVKPGTRTIVDVDATLFFRQGDRKFGIAPLTSMFLYGEGTQRRFDDFRPEIHDSDGLLMHTGQDEWIWRPLANPQSLRVSAFLDENPKGFGLMQRDRDPAHYLDLEADYEHRPSIWIEPRDVPWGKGAVQLVEIPSNEEIHDNIVAFWVFDKPFKTGESVRLSYRLHTVNSAPGEGTLARIIRTRIGWAGVAGMENPPPKRVRRVVVDFQGTDLGTLSADQPVTAKVETSKGQIDDVVVQKVPNTENWRLSFRLTPEGEQQADMRAFLTMRGEKLTESWSYIYAPSALE